MKGSMMLVLSVLPGLSLPACSNRTADATAKGDHAPAKVEHIDGTETSRITLSAKAAERLDIQIAEVQAVTSPGLVRPAGTGSMAGQTAVPYAAVLYDANGGTWVYTNPEPLVFMRHRITVVHIDEDRAVLSEGPPVGTRVVTFGAAELFGAEFEIGH